MDKIRKIVGLLITKSGNNSSKFYTTTHGKILHNPKGGVPNDDDFYELVDIHMTFGTLEMNSNDKFEFSGVIDTYKEKTDYYGNYFEKLVASTDESLGLPGFDNLLDLRHYADWIDATGVSCEFTYVKKCVKCKKVMENHLCVCGEDSNYFLSFKVHTVDNKVKLLGSL